MLNVVALGHKGSGKTMLLTSMFHELHTMSTRSYHLTAPLDQVNTLDDWFGEVADPTRAWPRGTAVAATRSFAFTVQARTGSGRPLPVLVLNYLEYAGGLLTDHQPEGSTAQADLVAQIGQAHALIAVIDGYWIRQWMDRKPEAGVRLQQSITTMVTLLMYSQSPITFVITKWDLLSDIDPDEENRLRFVRQALMQNPGFRELVQIHSSRRVVRLIPVSAVGTSFAELDASGAVNKLASGELRPTNVDAPLAAVVPDVWDHIERSVDTEELRRAVASVNGTTGRRHLAALADLGATVGMLAGRTLGYLAPPVGLILDLATAMSSSGDVDEQVTRALIKKGRGADVERELQANRAARRRVLRELQSRVDVLEGRLPSSRLEPGV